MNIRKLLVAAAAMAALPAAFAQAGPGALRGEGWYLMPGASAQVGQDLRATGARAPAMPDYDFVAGEAGWVPHQHQYMEQNEQRAKAMGNRGFTWPAAGGTRVQGPEEIKQYQKAGG